MWQLEFSLAQLFANFILFWFYSFVFSPILWPGPTSAPELRWGKMRLRRSSGGGQQQRWSSPGMMSLCLVSVSRCWSPRRCTVRAAPASSLSGTLTARTRGRRGSAGVRTRRRRRSRGGSGEHRLSPSGTPTFSQTPRFGDIVLNTSPINTFCHRMNTSRIPSHPPSPCRSAPSSHSILHLPHKFPQLAVNPPANVLDIWTSGKKQGNHKSLI